MEAKVSHSHDRASGPQPGLVPFRLVAVGVGGQFLIYLLTITLARVLPIEAFETCVAAAALFTFLVSVAPLGAEKLALRALPTLRRNNDWPTVEHFVRFARRSALRGILMIVGTGVSIALLSRLGLFDLSSVNQGAAVAVLFLLPVGVGALVGVEVLTALGLPTVAAILFRIVAPVCLLLGIGAAFAFGVPLGAIAVILLWGAGWAIAFGLMMMVLARHKPAPVTSSRPANRKDDEREWSRLARPLWAYKVGFALLTSTPILYLDLAGQPSDAVSAYAAALSIVGVMTVIVTSTNRYYASKIALSITGHERTGERFVKKMRSRWMMPTVLVLATSIILFARPLMHVFGAEFVEQGSLALRILTVTAAVSMLLSLNPTALKYRNENRWAISGLMVGVLVQFGALAMLVAPLGAAGAAVSHFCAVCAMHVIFFVGSRKTGSGKLPKP